MNDPKPRPREFC